ncbi:nuclear receptor coactivator 2, partial [Tachysurus ichikawai]
NRQPMMNQMTGVSNMNLPLRPNVPNQGTINAQMLAQRQRELLSNHLRQRQRSMSMRPQGLNVPSNMAAGTMGSSQIAHGNPTHFPYTPNYGISQQPDSGFGGAATPQSPLVSPRMGHAQSPMMQQGNATFQSSPEMNGWTQGNMNANSMYTQQASSGVYNSNGMSMNVTMTPNTNSMSNMAQMGTEQTPEVSREPL